ncbi:MAG: DUF2029 domain-containing protein [bacterium]|nr:DUF2029 domain-containing protein [bacterium]
MSKIKINLLVLLFLILIAGIANIPLGAEIDWDYLAYHYYNAYAVLNNRLDIDMMPSGIQSYLNPVLDIISYVMVNSLKHYPKLLLFLQAMPYAFLGFSIYLLNKELFIKISEKKLFNCILIFVSSVICLSETTLISEFGMSFNDIQITTLIVLALWLLIKSFKDYKSKYLKWAGFLIGLACGLKFTTGIYAITLVLAYMLCAKHDDIKELFKQVGIICLFSLLGLVVIDGWWACILWHKFKNPVFPYYNSIFKSEWFTSINYHDYKFWKSGFFNILFLPLKWSETTYVFYEKWNLFVYESARGLPSNNYNIVIEWPFFDLRHVFMYFSTWILCFFVGRQIFVSKIAQDIQKPKNIFEKISRLFNKIDNLSIMGKEQLFLLSVVIISYFIWATHFGIIRYLLPSLVLCGTFIVMVVIQFTKWLNDRRLYLGLIYLLFIVNIGYCTNPGARSDVFLYAPDLHIEDNSVVYLSGKPASYLIAGQNKNARYIYLTGDADGGDYNFTQTDKYFELVDFYSAKAKKKYLIKRKTGIPYESHKSNTPEIIKKYIKKPKKCKDIKTKYTYSYIPKFEICEFL